MEFFAANGTRPVRLCEETRAFAYESLNHKYGRETYANHGVAMDDYEGFPDLSAIENTMRWWTVLPVPPPCASVPMKKSAGQPLCVWASSI